MQRFDILAIGFGVLVFGTGCGARSSLVGGESSGGGAPTTTSSVTVSSSTGAAPTGFLDVAAGWAHSCGVRVDGSVVCWGASSFGESTPPGGSFLRIAAGQDFTCGVRSDHSLACWDTGARARPPLQRGSSKASGPAWTSGVLCASAAAWPAGGTRAA